MKMREIRLATSVLGVAAAALALSGCIGPTYGTGKTAGEQLVSDLDGMFSLGSTNEGEAISYAPRAELVKPKDTSILPPPRDSVDSANDPNWPESPEVRSARIKAAADRRNAESDIVQAEVALADKEGITDAQIAANSGSGSFDGRMGGDPTDHLLTPQELDSGREAFKEKLRQSKQGSPTQRKYLSEPPIAYRQPAATAPVGDPGVDERVKEAKLKKNTGLGEKLRNLLPF